MGVNLLTLDGVKMAKSKESFEASLKHLEEVVSSLEVGEKGLEESLQLFEDGVNHYKKCKQLLVEAEKKIGILTESLKIEEYEE